MMQQELERNSQRESMEIVVVGEIVVEGEVMMEGEVVME